MTIAAYDVAKIIQHRLPGFKPKIAMILGSGSGDLAHQIEDPTIIPYSELPGFHTPTVEGHGGKLYLGKIKGVSMVCLQGRAHYYEGIDNAVIKTMVRSMKLLGCETWLATNAAGSLQKKMKPGGLVLVKDHINFQFNSALVGPNEDDFGTRFPGMEDAYDLGIRKEFLRIAKKLKIPLVEGVYLGVVGPSFETPAEINAYRILGADLVGMSTIPEVIVARHCAMKVGVISVVTNMAAGMSDEKITHEAALKMGKTASEKLIALISAYLESCR